MPNGTPPRLNADVNHSLFEKAHKRTIDAPSSPKTLPTPYNRRTAPERLAWAAGVYPHRTRAQRSVRPKARRQRVRRIIVCRWARLEDEDT